MRSRILKLSKLKWCLGILFLMLISFHVIFFLIRSFDSRFKKIDQPYNNYVPNELENKITSSLLEYSIDSSNLPRLTYDRSEFVIGSIIERTWIDEKLFITSFLLSHSMLEPRLLGAERIHPDALDDWREAMVKFEGAEYTENGVRVSNPGFYCKIRNSMESESYIVNAEFLPNKLSPDSNSNRRYDILRCKIEVTDAKSIEILSKSTNSVEVELRRGENVLMKYFIPWNSRRAGYMLSSPDTVISSKFNAWAPSQSYDTSKPRKPVVNLCVPGFRKAPIKSSVQHYLEFVEHHILIGISHIFLSTTFCWNSKNMARIIKMYKGYIDQGLVSISSQAGDGIDSVLSTRGITWNRISIKVLNANMCLYLSKGVADYVGIWDLDEFFIPKVPYQSILEVIAAMESPDKIPLPPPSEELDLSKVVDGWKGGRGLADGDGHPFCYLSTSVATVGHSRLRKDADWIGDHFSHAPEDFTKNAGLKSILPTRTIFQAGLHMSGACKLEPEWTGCNQGEEFCYSKSIKEKAPQRLPNGTYANFRLYHKFDEMVMPSDVKRIDPVKVALIYHYMVYREDVYSSEKSLKLPSDYTLRFYPTIRKNIENNGYLNISIDLPKVITFPTPIDEKWIKFELVYKNRKTNIRANKIHPKLVIPVITTLPSFAVDGTELVLGSIIERVYDSYELYLTTFMVCHFVLTPQPDGYGVERVNPELADFWKSLLRAFEDVTYTDTGKRSSFPRFFCRISNAENSRSYVTRGEFVPNSLTPDANANRRLDILRCKMKDTEFAYRHLSRSNSSVSVEILREGFSLLNFTVPWRSRRTGYLLDSPGTTTAEASSHFNAWKGYDVRNPGMLPGREGGDRLHFLLPGLENVPSKANLPIYLEYVQHHLLLGVDHMFMATTFSWDSKHMDRFLQAFRSYINEGSVTVTSQCGDGIDNVYSLKGLSWMRDNIKIFHVNMFLYLSKGVADYVGIWDLDEFFIPKVPYQSILEVIAAMESPDKIPLPPPSEELDLSKVVDGWKGGRGLADGDGHPFCYLLLRSLVVLNKETDAPVDLKNPWIGDIFSHGPEPKHAKVNRQMGFKKSILPTRTIFQAGLHMSGACKLEPEWTGCGTNFQGNCYNDVLKERVGFMKKNATRLNDFFRFNHNFDDMVWDNDAKSVNIDEMAVIYHLQIHRGYLNAASEEALQSTNEYTSRFYKSVMQELTRRGLALTILLPSTVEIQSHPDLLEGWVDFKTSFSAHESFQQKNLPPLEIPPSISTIEKKLPAFANDFSEMVLGALIERKSSSYDLYLTTFLLSHSMILQQALGDGITAIRSTNYSTWTKALEKSKLVTYDSIGLRVGSQRTLYCRISNTVRGYSYLVAGEFVPNRLIPDGNANRRLDILRCKMKDTEFAYRHLSRSNSSVSVEILREGFSLLNFTVPWRSRRTGYLLDSPGTTTAEASSHFNAWKGYDVRQSQSEELPGKEGGDRLHMCVPGLETPPSQRSLPQHLEFVQLHLLLGVDHIFLGASLHWESKHMTRLLEAFRSYIDDGALSISSHTSDSVDNIYSVEGLSLHRDSAKVIFVNKCLYLSKGVADYVGIWDLDEFFIPKVPYQSILEVIAAMESPDKIPLPPPSEELDLSKVVDGWKGGRGLADGDGHPFCYLLLSSKIVVNADKSPVIDPEFPFLGHRFPHGAESLSNSKVMGFKKSILPTRTIFQAGLHMSGACKLEPEWTGCSQGEEFCYSKSIKEKAPQRLPNGTYANFRLYHKFDEVVMPSDAKQIDPNNVALIYHYYTLNREIARVASAEARATQNEYTTRFFPEVYKELRRRGLNLLVTLPEVARKSSRVDMDWMKYKPFYDSIAVDVPINVMEKNSKVGTTTAKVAAAAPVLYVPPRIEAIGGAATDPLAAAQAALAPREYRWPEYSAPIPLVATLPSFTVDESDLFLGSVIERSFDSWELHLTSFLLGHHMLFQVINDYGLPKVRPDAVDFWKRIMIKMERTKLSDTGVRDPLQNFTCRISNSESTERYDAKGEFVPNRLTPDANANRRLDILRCKMKDTEFAYRHLSRSNSSVSVEILREGFSLLNFTVPWRSRRTGFLLSVPEEADVNRYDAWHRYDPDDKQPPSIAKSDVLHICAPGLEDYPSQTTLPLYLEYVQHHLLAGVSHINIGAVFGWTSPHMNILSQAFRSYINEGSVSLMSQTGDGQDSVYSLMGLLWYRDNVKILQITSYMYFGKGLFQYCGVWDLDEYFIPRPPYKSIVDIIKHMESPGPIPTHPPSEDPFSIQPKWKGGKGLADDDGHPFCYLLLSSEVILNRQQYSNDVIWMGDRYSHAPEAPGTHMDVSFAFKKSILPTSRIFYAGLHMSGACKMDPAWTGCGVNFTDNCYSISPRERGPYYANGKSVDFRLYHKFDETVMDQDTKRVNSNKYGVVYHLQRHREQYVTKNATLLSMRSDYNKYYFQEVLKQLKARSLDLLVSLPETVSVESLPSNWHWTKYAPIYEDRNSLPYNIPFNLTANSTDTSLSNVIYWKSSKKKSTVPTSSKKKNDGKSSQEIVETEFTKLPSFVIDYSELILSALVERVHISYDLFLTIFMLCHRMLNARIMNAGMGPLRIVPGFEGNWQHVMRSFENVSYSPYGHRTTNNKYYCRIANSIGTLSYIVPAEFVPNALTPDGNANRRLDILRCKMKDTEFAYHHLSRSNSSVSVEILREGFSLLNFTVPWRSRRTGYLLDSPGTTAEASSHFNAWKGYDVRQSQREEEELPGKEGGDRLHMCVPGLETPPSKATLRLYLEFVQHHLLLGVDHMFMAATFSWDSKHMDRFLQSFRSYINEGKASVFSHAGDDVDTVYSLKGMSFHRDTYKVIQVNMCLYLSKGVADYVGIWDLDEFFIPKVPYQSILEVIAAMESPDKIPLPPPSEELDLSKVVDGWKGGRGLADGDGHPFCYLLLSSLVVLPKKVDAIIDFKNQSLGEMFTYGPEPKHAKVNRQMGFKKSILPTRTIFQAGLHMSGACKLEPEWTGCGANFKDNCYYESSLDRGLTQLPNGRIVNFRRTHKFDEAVMDEDAKAVDPDTFGVIYHYMLRSRHDVSASKEALNTPNEYYTRFYPAVKKQLYDRGLDLVTTLPNTVPQLKSQMFTSEWIPRAAAHASRHSIFK